MRRAGWWVMGMLAVSTVGLSWGGAGCSLTLKEMGSASGLRGEVTPSSQFSIVTMNTWQLHEQHRIPRLLKALGKLGHDLGIQKPHDPLPDVVLFQELEDDRAIATLGKRLRPTHSFHVCPCAQRSEGGTHSAVAIAVRRSRFRAGTTRCHDLGSLWPDHRRCAVGVPIQPAHGKPLEVVNVHLSVRPGNSPQARRLLRTLREQGYLKRQRLVLGGDFNFNTGSQGYNVFTEELRDFFPRPYKRGRTHWFGGRLDYFFVSDQLSLVRTLNRRLAYKVIQPSSSLFLPSRCRKHDAPTCPLSDHVPEGAVFQYTPRN